MKTLLLLRHAEAAWSTDSQRDFARPLNERGREAAALLGSLMHERRVQPDLILCSPAVRARQTAALIIEAAALKSKQIHDARIYEADTATLLEVLAQMQDTIREALLVGHNPGLSDLLTQLTGDDRHLPAAGLACISLDIKSWDEPSERGGQLEWYMQPEEIA